MKQLEKKDLIKDQIYKHINGPIFMWNINDSKYYLGSNNLPNEINYFGTVGFFDGNGITEATPEEKHWLEVCIAANRFISYEEAMKTFIPEYVECTLQQVGSDYNLGKIYKVNTTSQNVNKIESHNNQGMAFYQMNKHRFKPSAKEAYDAQFVVKEPKDKVLLNRANSNHNSQILTISKVESSEGAIYQLGDKIKVFTKDSPNKGKVFTIKGFRWNNAKTAICAITELHSKNGIGLDKIELYSEPVVKIVEDFKLPEAWWITIKNEKQLEITKQYFRQHFNSLSALLVGGTIGYFPNRGFMEYAYHLTNRTKQNNPQITFKQFEQHVLHSGFKVGDRFNKVKSLSFPGRFNNVTEREIIDLQYINNESVAFYKIIETNHSGPQCRILTKIL